MECLIRGCNFLLKNISNEVFEFHREQKPPYVFQDLDHSELFPYLLVNIGSGVSIVKVKILLSFKSWCRLNVKSRYNNNYCKMYCHLDIHINCVGAILAVICILAIWL